jgi:hypothetical protein|tara:strand:- start:1274 stop:3286 length:2013 start_codon:yes stop_codon:yes gene_type:complete
MAIKLTKLDLPDVGYTEVRNEYTLYKSSGEEWRYQIAEDEDFYLGNQLTDSQKEYLESVGQPPEANNKIRPAVETVLANIAAASPEWDVRPIGKTDNDLAYVCNQMLDWVWRESDGDVQFRKACKDFIIKGLAYLYVYPDWNADGGLGGARFRRISPESVFVDPNTMLPDFSDSSSMMFSDLHTKESLKAIFPQYAKKIEEAREDHEINEQGSGKYSRDQVWTRGDVSKDHQAMIRKYVRFSKVNVPMVLITDMNTGSSKKFDRDQYKTLLIDPRYQAMVTEGIIVEELIYDQHIREVAFFGDEQIYDEILPITSYPIIPACNEHTSTPFPSGDVRHAKTPQRMLNRTEALLISHTTATTNFKLLYEDGALDPGEVNKWHIPNALIRVNPGALKEQKIKEFAPPSVSSQLYSEKQRYELDIEQVFGAYKYLQGSSSDAPGSVGEAQIVDEAVARKQNWKILPIYDMITKASSVVQEWMPHIYTQQRILRVVNPDGNAKELTINEPVIDDKSGAVMTMYDMQSAKVDVKVVIGSTRAKSPAADLQRDLALLSAGIYDKTQVIMNMQGDIDKTSLIARHSEIQQLRGAVEQMEGELKQLQGDMQTREREIFHANMRAEIAEATKSTSQAVSNIKANAKLEEARQRDASKKVKEGASSVLNAINSEPAAPAIG